MANTKPFNPIGIRMRSFGRNLISRFEPTATLETQPSRPSATGWNNYASLPLAWKTEQPSTTETQTASSSQVAQAPRQRSSVERKTTSEPPTLPPDLLHILELHEQRDAKVASRQAELREREQQRTVMRDAASTSTDAEEPVFVPRRRATIVEVTPTQRGVGSTEDEVADADQDLGFEADLSPEDIDWSEEDTQAYTVPEASTVTTETDETETLSSLESEENAEDNPQTGWSEPQDIIQSGQANDWEVDAPTQVDLNQPPSPRSTPASNSSEASMPSDHPVNPLAADTPTNQVSPTPSAFRKIDQTAPTTSTSVSPYMPPNMVKKADELTSSAMTIIPKPATVTTDFLPPIGVESRPHTDSNPVMRKATGVDVANVAEAVTYHDPSDDIGSAELIEDDDERTWAEVFNPPPSYGEIYAADQYSDVEQYSDYAVDTDSNQSDEISTPTFRDAPTLPLHDIDLSTALRQNRFDMPSPSPATRQVQRASLSPDVHSLGNPATQSPSLDANNEAEAITWEDSTPMLHEIDLFSALQQADSAFSVTHNEPKHVVSPSTNIAENRLSERSRSSPSVRGSTDQIQRTAIHDDDTGFVTPDSPEAGLLDLLGLPPETPITGLNRLSNSQPETTVNRKIYDVSTQPEQSTQSIIEPNTSFTSAPTHTWMQPVQPIQRAPEDGSMGDELTSAGESMVSTADSQQQDQTKQDTNIDELARQVLNRLRAKLRIEHERHSRRS